MSSTNFNVTLLSNHRNPSFIEKIDSIEMYLLYFVTIVGITINLVTILFLLIIPTYRIKSSCFLFHHCLICLTLSTLCLPYSLSFCNYSIRCDYLGNIQVTCVTAQLLNMAAMVASEAYRFEDLIHQETCHSNPTIAFQSIPSQKDNCQLSVNCRPNNSPHYFQYQLKQSNHSTISCGCLSFGILIIWFSSIILHLGITMIGTESKSYYHELGQYCNFIITDIRGYVLTLMWIIITIFSLIITVRYIHKILKEVSSSRRQNQPLLSLAILGQSHGESIASRDILMQQIQYRIKLNILLIIFFILFWFPLFIVTLCDIKFKISEHILRYLLLFAWSNSSLSPLGYCLLLPKCTQFCSFSWRKDRSSTYDSLTSYYNRIGDRFHDIAKWDQYQREEEEEEEENHQLSNQTNLSKSILENEKENCVGLNEIANLCKTRQDKCRPAECRPAECRPSECRQDKCRQDKCRQEKCHSKTNSLVVKEICSLTTKKCDRQLSNGLLITSSKRVHL